MNLPLSILWLIWAALVIFLGSCSGKDTNSASVGVFVTLSTVKYDDHTFIVAKGYHEGALIHHPDCPCGKR